jgi:hypothetical protein
MVNTTRLPLAKTDLVTPIDSLSLIKGAQWFSLSRHAVFSLLTRPDARELLFWFRNTYIPDEHYSVNLAARGALGNFVMNSTRIRPLDRENYCDILDQLGPNGKFWFARKVTKTIREECVQRIYDYNAALFA